MTPLNEGGQRIRVLHICQRDDPATGGAVQVAATLVRQLTSNPDVDAKILFLYGEPGTFAEELGDRCEYLRLRNSRDVPFSGWKLYRRMMFADIVHHHDMLPWSNLASILLPRLKRVMHGHVAAGVRSFGVRTRISNYLQISRLECLVAITKKVAETWQASGVSAQQILVINNGIDFAKFSRSGLAREQLRKEMGFKSSDLVVGFVGRLHNVMKGTDDVISTLQILPDQYKALIVGDGPDREALNRQAIDLNVEKRICFTGSVDCPQQYYSAMDLFLFSSRFEHFGLTPLEAIAAELPVFSFACHGGFNEWATEDFVFRVPNRDCQAMATLIQGSIESGAAKSKAAEAFEVASDRLDASTMATKTAAVYRKLMRSDK